MPLIQVEVEAPPAEVEAVRALALELGPQWQVRPSFARFSAADLPWQVMLVVPLSAFVAAFAADAGHAAWSWVSRVYAARRGPGSVTVLDNDSGTWIVLSRDDPPEAYDALGALNPRAVAEEARHLTWDQEAARWAPPH